MELVEAWTLNTTSFTKVNSPTTNEKATAEQSSKQVVFTKDIGKDGTCMDMEQYLFTMGNTKEKHSGDSLISMLVLRIVYGTKSEEYIKKD